MNIVKYDLTFVDGQKKTLQLHFSEAQLNINDEVILSGIEYAKNHTITTCNIGLGANNIAVNIENYTLTDTLYFSAFYNMPSNISIFKSTGTSIHMINQKIDLIQLDCQSILLANCQIKQFDIGLAEHHKKLMELSHAKDNSKLTAHIMDKIDIRDCQISSLKAYVECDYINVQGSIINTFNLNGGFGGKVIAEIKKLNIWQYTTINISEIHCKISEFKISESTISNFVAKSHCIMGILIIEDSDILNTYNFKKTNFSQLNSNAWLLIEKSAANSKDLHTRAEANYQIAKGNYKNEKGFNKFIGLLFELCTGYGYKPIRALLSCVVLIISVFVILSVKDFICLGSGAVNVLFNNATISIAALAGQSGLQRCNGFEFWVVIVEYIGGIIIFAMFVNALYVRYKD